MICVYVCALQLTIYMMSDEVTDRKREGDRV